MPQKASDDILRIAAVWPLLGGVLLAASPAGVSGNPDLVPTLFTWLEWSLLTPLVVFYVHSTDDVPRLCRIRHAAGIAAAGLLHLLLFASFYAAWSAEWSFVEVLRARYSRHFVFAAVNYSLIVTAVNALAKSRAARQASIARARLGQEIARAELDLARSTLRGDEVLAALTDIEQKTRTDPAEAEKSIYRLTRMLRVALEDHRTSTAEAPAVGKAPPPASLPGARAALLIALAFPLFGAAANSIRIVAFDLMGMAPPWPMAAALIGGWCVAGVFAPLLLYATRYIALRRESFARANVLTVAIVIVFAVATEALARSGLVRPGEQRYGLVDDGLTLKLILGLLVVAGVHAAVLDWRRYQADLETIALSQRLDEARLTALLAQLQPHFLFNALNSIVTLVARDPARAAAVTRRLRELLEAVFSREQRQEVRISDEIGIVTSYVAIEQARLGSRLRFRCEIASGVERALVPALLLQPLVENAIRHGISPRAAGGEVILRSREEHGRLLIEVEDDGVGIEDDARNGIGFSNLIERLRHLYGGAHSLSVDSQRHGGTRIRLVLPLRPAEEAAP
ncbi:MAG TPA: histidine kinase [Thermoanaerobaculia bacterium]|nr:histidine kinase [Thermoanaerobaculia bacterium]